LSPVFLLLGARRSQLVKFFLVGNLRISVPISDMKVITNFQIYSYYQDSDLFAKTPIEVLETT